MRILATLLLVLGCSLPALAHPGGREWHHRHGHHGHHGPRAVVIVPAPCPPPHPHIVAPPHRVFVAPPPFHRGHGFPHHRPSQPLTPPWRRH